MAFVCLLRDDEPKKEEDWFAIGRIEGYGDFRPHEHTRRGGALRHSRVRNRDPMPQARRAQLLACGQALQYLRIRKAMALRKKRGDPFE